jgi:AcrR family transcriptional regulator
VQRIFRATSHLLETVHLEQITTSRIAHDADISIGALYRFFPDKQSILDAIAVHHIEDFRASMESRLPAIGAMDGSEFLGAVIEAYVEFLDARPDFRTIAFGQHISEATRRRHAHPDAGSPGFVKRFMVEMLGMGNVSELDLRLRVAIEAGEKLIIFAYEQPDDAERARVIAELKRLLSGYLFS